MGCWEWFWEGVLAVLSLLHSLHTYKNITKSVLFLKIRTDKLYQNTRFLNVWTIIFSFFIFFPIFMFKCFSFLSVLWTLSGYTPCGHQKSMFHNKRESHIFRFPVFDPVSCFESKSWKNSWESSKNLSRRFEEDGEICTWIGGTGKPFKINRNSKRWEGKLQPPKKEGGGRQHHQKKGGERSTSKRKSRQSKKPIRGEGKKAQPPKRREEKAASLEKRTQHHTEGRGRTTTLLCSHPLLGWCCSLPSFLPWVWCCFSTPPRGRGLPLSSFSERCCFPSTWRGVRDGPLSLWVVMPSPPFFWVVLLSSLPSSFLWWFQNILKNENLLKEDENKQRKQEGISQREREKVALPKYGGRKRHHRKKEHTAQVCLLFNWTWLEKNNIIRRLRRTFKKKKKNMVRVGAKASSGGLLANTQLKPQFQAELAATMSPLLICLCAKSVAQNKANKGP